MYNSLFPGEGETPFAIVRMKQMRSLLLFIVTGSKLYFPPSLRNSTRSTFNNNIATPSVFTGDYKLRPLLLPPACGYRRQVSAHEQLLREVREVTILMRQVRAKFAMATAGVACNIPQVFSGPADPRERSLLTLIPRSAIGSTNSFLGRRMRSQCQHAETTRRLSHPTRKPKRRTGRGEECSLYFCTRLLVSFAAKIHFI